MCVTVCPSFPFANGMATVSAISPPFGAYPFQTAQQFAIQHSQFNIIVYIRYDENHLIYNSPIR